jgi:phage shock protein E
MNLTLWIIIAAVVVALFLLQRMSFLSADKARQFLRDGAVVVDVRNPGEFSSGHVPGAINIPLGDLGARAPEQLRDKSQILLLHCLSGTRSGIARRQLKSLGYRNVFNLGSYGRAESIIRAAAKA